MKELVFLLEEASAQAMLEGLLPKLLPDRVKFSRSWFDRLTTNGKI